MRLIKPFLLLLVFVIGESMFSCFSQNQNIDSLWALYKNAKHDTTRIILLNEEIGYYFESENPDTAVFFYNEALNIADKGLSKKNDDILRVKFLVHKATSLRYIGFVKNGLGIYDEAIDFYLKSMNIYNEIIDKESTPNHIFEGKKGLASCNTSLGNVYSDQGNYEQAMEFYNNSLKLNTEVGDKRGIAGCYTNIGSIYTDMGGFDKAIQHYLKSLTYLEKINDKKGISYCYNNIGNIHFFQNSYEKAIQYYLKSLKYKEELGDLRGMSGCYNNLGIIYNAKKEHETAIDYYNKSLLITQKLGDISGSSACYSNIGQVYEAKGNFDMAIEYYQNALEIVEQIGDKNGLIVCYNNIGALNVLLANSSIEKSTYLKKALEYGTKAYLLAKEINAIPRQREASHTIISAYKMMGDFEKAFEFAEIFIAANDSMFELEKTSSIADAEKKFESEKKQLQIEKLNKEKELQQSELLRQQETGRQQKIIIVFVIAGIILIGVFAFFVVQRLKVTRRQKLIIEKQKAIVDEKNSLLNQQNEEIMAQRYEIESQRDLVMSQKDHIEEQKQKITDSINYALNIQQAVLPTGDYANKILGSHFILFKPKDIVSGDFYWATRVNEMLIVTVADCTGHGVPGAFMSMLGVSFLNEIVRKKEVTKASEVLDYLRISIIEALQQKGSLEEQKDGMDISLVVIDNSQFSINNYYLAQWAGANNPLYIVKNEENTKLDELSTFNFELYELKPDKMPVAIFEHMNPFTNHEIQLFKGDSIYLTSDGFQDQFGGSKGKKFMSKQLKQLFINNCHLSMMEQKLVMEKAMIEWRGDYEQIDDITILGMKI